MDTLSTGLGNAIRTHFHPTRTSQARLGADALGEPKFVARPRKGESPRLDTAANVIRWMTAQCDAQEGDAIQGALGTRWETCTYETVEPQE